MSDSRDKAQLEHILELVLMVETFIAFESSILAYHIVEIINPIAIFILTIGLLEPIDQVYPCCSDLTYVELILVHMSLVFESMELFMASPLLSILICAWFLRAWNYLWHLHF